MESPLIVIVGPTASGKTSLSIKLAKKFNGEIICADSRTVYSDGAIGTAKPADEEMDGIVHWGLGIADPDDRYTAAQFKEYAIDKIRDIRSRGKVPFLVGGTGLYVDGVILDYEFVARAEDTAKDLFEQMSTGELVEYCRKNNIALPNNYKNKRHLISAIERGGAKPKSKLTPVDETIVVGITTDKTVLMQRIRQRIEQMFDDGVVGEAKELGDKYGWASPLMTGNIYRNARLLIEGKIDEKDFLDRSETADWQLSKRQMTWFKRRKFIKWFSLSGAEEYLDTYLAELNKS